MVEPGTRLGPYEIVARIGAGGMGEVYRAHDRRLGRDVAIKILPAEVSTDAAARKRFQREARAISALSHPNICALYDIGHEDGVDFLVMELLEGRTLAQRLAEGGPIPLAEAVPYAIGIASALEAAHRKGVVHRDLKPGNVMITPTGAKLLDFGLARLASTNEDSATGPLTVEGTMIGTIEYMSPEQLNGETIDARSDIFSLGVVLYEMITGIRPFRGSNRASVMGAILFSQPEPMSVIDSGLPPILERVANACLEKDRENRIQTAHDLRLQLQWTTSEGASGAFRSKKRARFTRRTAAIAFVAAVAGACVTAGMAIWREPETPPQIRFSLDAPHSNQSVDWATISPDGKRIAFVAENAAGHRDLWVRELSSTTPKLLPGTAGATQPFWSPDSNALAFFSADKLQLMRLDAAAPEAVATASSPRGGTWNRSGTLLYTPQVNASVWLTTAAAQPAREITRLDRAQGDITHRWPEFLPDGEHFTFVIRSRNLQRSGLYVGSITSRELKKIATLQSRVVHTSDGRMLFVNDKRLYSQPFNPESLELEEQPVEIAADLLPDLKVTGATRISASSDGILTFGSPGDMRTNLVLVDRSGQPLRTLASGGYFVNPALSPDEKTLAVSRIDEKSGKNSIWLMNVATGALSPFVADESNADGPVWSPDGKHILYTCDREGAYQVYERRVGAIAEDRLVLPSRTYAQPISALPRGTLFHVATPPGLGDFWFWPRGAARPTKLDRGSEGRGGGAADLSRDGRWFARLATAEDDARSVVEISILDSPEQRLEIAGEGSSQPTWRSDSREFYFLSGDDRLTAVSFNNGDLGSPTPLFSLEGTSAFYSNRDFVPLADGRRFIILKPVADSQRSRATVVVNWNRR